MHHDLASGRGVVYRSAIVQALYFSLHRITSMNLSTDNLIFLVFAKTISKTKPFDQVEDRMWMKNSSAFWGSCDKMRGLGLGFTREDCDETERTSEVVC